VAAATGNWSGELQLRYANADFTFNNVDLDLRDESADVDSYSLSGSMTYRFDLREGLALLPTVGFAVTDNDAASLTFRDEAGNNLGRLKVDSHTTKTTFLGATLSQTTINEAAATATNAFVTGTYYFDNSGSRDSTFTSADGSATADLNTSEIGDFGEISVGGSYVQVLGTARARRGRSTTVSASMPASAITSRASASPVRFACSSDPAQRPARSPRHDKQDRKPPPSDLVGGGVFDLSMSHVPDAQDRFPLLGNMLWPRRDQSPGSSPVAFRIRVQSSDCPISISANPAAT